MLEVTAVSKLYRRRAVVHDVTFAVQAGEVVGLVGPNGAGKSTILAMVAGLVRPSAGDIRILGRSVVRGPGAAAGLVGYVPQDLALYPALSVRDNLRFWAEMAGVAGQRQAARVAQVAELTGLSGLLPAAVRTLSGGMKRRLHIGIALLHEPPLLVMDEPTVGLDIQAGRDMAAFLRGQARAGKAILYSTHSALEIERLCDRIVVLNQGRLAFSGTPAEAMRAAAGPGESLNLEEAVVRLGQWQVA